MRDDLLDMLPFSPAPHWQSLLGDAPDQGAPSAVAVEIRAPGWQVLGHTRPTGQPPVDVERVWITWRAGACGAKFCVLLKYSAARWWM